MDKGICNGDYLPANQGAPYPTELAASEETWRSGMGAQRRLEEFEPPRQIQMKIIH